MSSSLFYDCYAPYETYPDTEYVEGDKKFGEIGIGGILYCLDGYDTLSELEVTNPFHVAKGRCYITIKGRGKNIDFGSQCCVNVLEARDKSIVFYDGSIIGTNKESVIAKRHNIITKEIEQTRMKCESLEKRLRKINSL
jgi:hypothetical protein